jgi:hypothetical protein
MLAIEKGRPVKSMNPVGQRVCKVCNTDKVEDEEHFLCDFPRFGNLHKRFYDIKNTYNVQYFY